jgi:hypothetical protein
VHKYGFEAVGRAPQAELSFEDKVFNIIHKMFEESNVLYRKVSAKHCLIVRNKKIEIEPNGESVHITVDGFRTMRVNDLNALTKEVPFLFQSIIESIYAGNVRYASMHARAYNSMWITGSLTIDYSVVFDDKEDRNSVHFLNKECKITLDQSGDSFLIKSEKDEAHIKKSYKYEAITPATVFAHSDIIDFVELTLLKSTKKPGLLKIIQSDIAKMRKAHDRLAQVRV